MKKYHSDWGDDYEEIGARSNTGMDKEFLSAAASGDLPDYYGVIGVAPDASPDEIKRNSGLWQRKRTQTRRAAVMRT